MVHPPVCDRSTSIRLTTLTRVKQTAHLKPPQSHRLFSRLAFDEDEYLLSQLEEDDLTSQYDPDDNDDEHIKRGAEPGDEIADGGWLEGDDIEDF